MILLSLLLSILPVHAATICDSNWLPRKAEFDAISKSGAQLEQNRIAVKKLLESENCLVKATLRKTGGARGVSAVIGYDYSEYYGRVVDAVYLLARKGWASALPILADAGYSHDSELGTFLISRPDLIIKTLVKSARDSEDSVQYTPTAMILRIVREKWSSVNVENRISVIRLTQELKSNEKSPLVLPTVKAIDKQLIALKAYAITEKSDKQTREQIARMVFKLLSSPHNGITRRQPGCFGLSQSDEPHVVIVHEIHSDRCGGDPATTPRIATIKLIGQRLYRYDAIRADYKVIR
jgi:hypothetical protein